MSDSERKTVEFIFSDPKKPYLSIEVIDLETLHTVETREVTRSDYANGKSAEKPAPPENDPQNNIT